VRWATRPNCHVDRAACAWLIKRRLDPEPEFIFVEDAGLDALMRGMSMLHDDETFLELAAKVYDGFYAYCKKIRELEDSVR
jgi:hypothetical protein